MTVSTLFPDTLYRAERTACLVFLAEQDRRRLITHLTGEITAELMQHPGAGLEGLLITATYRRSESGEAELHVVGTTPATHAEAYFR